MFCAVSGIVIIICFICYFI